MKAVSFSGEFAFLSVGGTAKGVIAIGGTAYGIVAVGAFLSVGAISIGMNAVGSVVALGMNTAAPVSISLINGLGVYSAAGVNSCGAWSYGGTNSTGVDSHGGVNSDVSLLPAILVVVIALVLSTVLRGKRAARARDVAIVSLQEFLDAGELRELTVRVRLLGVRHGALQLGGGPEIIAMPESDDVLERASTLAVNAGWLVARLVRVEETVPQPRSEEVGYRESPGAEKRTVVRCTSIEPAPERETWLPKDTAEVQWVIAWTARASAAVTIALLVWWTTR